VHFKYGFAIAMQPNFFYFLLSINTGTILSSQRYPFPLSNHLIL